MKLTLLDMVQDILSEMDSDEVNSIDDTPEAGQIVQILKNCYFEMISNRNWPHLKKLTTLEHSGDLSKPTHLKLPENIKELDYFNYNKAKITDKAQVNYSEVRFLYPDDFLRYCSNRRTTDNIRIVKDYGGTDLIIKTNQAPEYWTSFDDVYLVCDSYDSAADDTLKAAKTQAMIVRNPSWRTQDDFIPELPAEAFSAYLAEAKSTAFFALKQMMNEKVEAKAQRQQRWLSRKAWQAHGGVRYQNYGRRRVK